jgi:hypothetical protein
MNMRTRGAIHMKSLTPILFTLLVLGFATIPAEAGFRYPNPVVVTPNANGTGSVTGSIGSTRNMTGSTAYLGVWMQLGYADDPLFMTGGIAARDTTASGHTLNCMVPWGALYSYMPQLALVNSDSYIHATWEPAITTDPNTEEGTKCKSFENITQCCSYIVVASDSYDEPKN